MATVIGDAPVKSEPALTTNDVPAGLSEKLSAAFDSPDETTETQTEPTSDLPSADSAEGASETASSANETQEPAAAETASDETETETSTTSQGPVLPAAFRRTLKAYEYTDEEITEGLATQGEKFVAVAARLHNARNKEIAKFAEEGRKVKARQQAASTPAPQAEDDLPAVDVNALKKIYGNNEPLIDQLVTPLNKALAEIKSSRAVIREYQETQRRTTQETFAKQVNGFFADPELKDFHAQYGTDYKTLSDSQKAERVKVLRTADELMTGATVSGRLLSVSEALQLAHDATSSDVKEKQVRQKIATQLTKRQQGMTLKPAGRAATSAKPPDKMRASVKAGLSKAFG